MKRLRLFQTASLSLYFLFCSTTAMGWMDAGDTGVDEVLAIRDNQFAFYNGPSGQSEWLYNNGAKSVIRIKGYDDPLALGWDLTSYAGRVVEEAELHLCLYGGSIVNSLVVSTINSEWEEGGQQNSAAATGDSCWRWKSYPDVEWSYPGSDFSTVTFGNFGTLVDFGYKQSDRFRKYEKDGETWVAMKLDPAIVYAMILDNPGLVVTDPRFGFDNGNPAIYSSEAATSRRPRLLMRSLAATDSTPPEDVGGVAAEPGEWTGEMVVSFTAPSNPDGSRVFGYNVRYGTDGDFTAATEVERWRIPRPGQPGSVDRLLLENLTPQGTYSVWVQAYDELGNTSTPVAATVELPAEATSPVFLSSGYITPDASGKAISGHPGVLNYWACSELAKVNPVTGNRMADGYTGSGDDDYKKANPVWDSAANTIYLRAVRNQVIGFQVIIQKLAAELTGVSVTPSDLIGPGDEIIPASRNIELFRLHYTDGAVSYPDPAIPLSAPFATEFDFGSFPNLTYRGVWADVYVPRELSPGTYTGTLQLDADQLAASLTIALQVDVASTVLPDTPTFFLDLNGYGNKWNSEGSRYQVFQTAHKHRMVPNTLPYGWSESWSADRAPALTGNGTTRTISNWAEFADRYGPFFDGSAFSPEHPDYPYHGPGENTPIANFYTTGFEGWPMSLSDPDHGYDAAGSGYSYWKGLLDAGGSSRQTFMQEAPDVMKAFPTSFAVGSKNVWRQFAEYAQANGWKTAFQLYLNNKWDYSNTHSLWTLEEQYVADDFRADALFMGLARAGWDEADAPDTTLHLRIDTSSRWQQNWGQLKTIANVRAQGDGRSWDYRHDRYRHYLEQEPEQRWWYGTGPKRTDALKDHSAQILMHWSHGMTGGLPYWDSFRTDWGSADSYDANLSLFLSGDSVPGHGSFDGRIATIRMKAMRYGQQLCELLNLLSQQDGWNQTRVRRALSNGFGNKSGDGYDAFGGDEYSSLSIDDYYRLSGDLVATIEKVSLAGDVDGNGKVGVADAVAILQLLTESYSGSVGPNADSDGDSRLTLQDAIRILGKF
ncbi:fibronectin type III domain-containing protein [Desulfopila sp. IMCC35008]|uniref:fibronectin type III domain-containing protein n=1 Tax=Desulfopila sp. IMCC35008 TaxID=2653858 RepID=UPI0013D12178|nr:fibronectin type III domain-containing protein [Desulfopila sp. IMCC35008]